VIQGKSDPLVKPKVTRKLIKLYPGLARYEEVHGEHDLMRSEQPVWAQITGIISQFIEATRENKRKVDDRAE
jgi:hypothetical protein